MSRETVAQDRARAYFQSTGALAPAVVGERIAAAFEALDAVLTGVSAEQASRASIPSEWSVQEGRFGPPIRPSRNICWPWKGGRTRPASLAILRWCEEP